MPANSRWDLIQRLKGLKERGRRPLMRDRFQCYCQSQQAPQFSNNSNSNAYTNGLECYGLLTGKQLPTFRRSLLWSHPQGIRRQHTPPKVTLHQSTRYKVPEDVNLYQNPRENLMSGKDGDVMSCRLHCAKRFQNTIRENEAGVPDMMMIVMI